MTVFERNLFASLREALNDQRIIVLTGMRRVGKTTTIHWLLDQVEGRNKIFLDLERRDYRDLFEEKNYDFILKYFQNLGLDPNLAMTIALDEIQLAPNLPSVVKYLYDHYGIKFILSGSSSFYLKNLFSESISGRKILFELYPLTFGEYLTFRDIPHISITDLEQTSFSLHEYQRLIGEYTEFVKYGGLPNVVLEPKIDRKIEILKDVLSSYINLDVQALAEFRKINELQKLMSTLAIRIGNKIDLLKISQIVGISRPTLNEYLEFLEKTYIIYQMPAFANGEKKLTLGRKLYFVDNGIATILAQISEGALFENAVYNQLKHFGELMYYAKGNDQEIDFILTDQQNQQSAWEVKFHPVVRDRIKLTRLSEKLVISRSSLIGMHPTVGFVDFVWGGSIR